METGFKDLLLQSIAGDNDATAAFVERLHPMIKKCGKIARSDCAETDLIIIVLEELKRLDYEQALTYHEGQLVLYFKKLIYRRAIDLYRKNSKEYQFEIADEEINNASYGESFGELFFYDLISSWTERQKQVVTGKLILKMPDTELAEALHISRQAVNRLYNRALKELRKEAENDGRTTH